MLISLSIKQLKNGSVCSLFSKALLKGGYSERKEFAPRGSKFFPLREESICIENYFNHRLVPAS